MLLTSEDIASLSVATRNLSKGYDKGPLAVDSLDLSIRPGEVFGLLGPNGAGKTTTIRMLLGLLRPTCGQVFVHGEEITTGRQRVKSRLGVCPQETVLWPELTVSEHLYLIGRMYDVPGKTLRAETERLIGEFSLGEKRNQPTKRLSGGLRRRLNLAMALVHGPDVIMLDEPSAGLDPQSRALLWERVKQLTKDGRRTVVLTTHSMEEADRLSDRVGILDHGKMLVLDTPDVLKRSIGEGDVLEMELDRAPSSEAMEALRRHGRVEQQAATATTVSVRGLDIMQRFPGIVVALTSSGVVIRGTRLRPNTLEDVFLKMTGRSLRD
ncbi:MAG: ABC transporter ATP-binding protein [Candidatus Eisenbacteria bacterium]|nr:ABC transporter ATP-binding protein [Candidatus Eisenbacteria bacterium]